MESLDQSVDLAALYRDSVPRTLADDFREEREDRLKIKDSKLQFGVSFLDDCLGGLLKEDLFVFGAKSGVGKTQLALQMAMSFALQGKKVCFLALESDKYELARRMKYQFIYEKLRAKYGPYANYMDWASGEISEDSDIETPEGFDLITLIHRGPRFGIEELDVTFRERQESHVFIIDHLHYLDIEGDQEHIGIRDTVKYIRSLSQELQKPVILISHLRKPPQGSTLPTIEEFHGSSEIYKMATKVVALSNQPIRVRKVARDRSVLTEEVKGTVITTLKNRMDSSRVGLNAYVEFSPTTRAYMPGYRLVEEMEPEEKGKKKFISQIVDEGKGIPIWAKNCIRCYK